MPKISELTSIAGAGISPDDLIALVDVSDASMAASGTDKQTTVADLAEGLGGGVIDVAFKRRSSGDLTLNSTNWANVDTGMDITVNAAAGDIVEVSLNCLLASASPDVWFDVVTVVSAAPLNSFCMAGAKTTAPPGYGLPGWVCRGSSEQRLTGTAFYTVVSGDVVSGAVTLRLRYATQTATNRTFQADGTNYVAQFGAKVYRPT